jgi:hypothetical protein
MFAGGVNAARYVTGQRERSEQSVCPPVRALGPLAIEGY